VDHSSPPNQESPAANPPTDAGPSPLRSVHTTNFPAILDHLGSSLLVTTYQAGKLVVVRSNDGVINTHFRAFNKPMGLAVGRGRLAVGTAVDVSEFRNVPAVSAKLEPLNKHDAVFLPRSAHVTGDVQIHEMVYVGDEVLFVNTRFSCLAKHDLDHSFAPVWRPKSISAYMPDDRCHLNGLCLIEGRPRWVTALGEEVFAVALLPGMRFPDLINDNPELIGSSFVLPDAALRDVPPDLRSDG